MLFKPILNYPINFKRFFSLLVLLFLSPLVDAQNEAAIWSAGNGYQINFQSGDAVISKTDENNAGYATICDKEGNLVLYSDGRTIWNAQNEVLVNGEDLTSEKHRVIRRPVFVPYPKKEGSYFLIYQYSPKDDYNIPNKKMVYAEINSIGSGGRGEVVSKDILIHSNYHYEPTIAGFCNNSYFWIVIDRNNPVIDYGERRDIINLYKIDENGLNTKANVDSYINIGNSHGYKFSPNGDKICFTYQENVQHDIRYVVADFNFLTGTLYNIRTPSITINYAREFSSNSRYLYYFSGTKLMQLDAVYTSGSRMRNTTIIDIPHHDDAEYQGLGLQLAPDGKIYFTYYGDNNEIKLGRINQPNNPGLACDVELDLYTFESSIDFPKFVTSFFRDKNPENLDEQFPNAGPDLEICSKASVKIGTEGHPEALYHWQPETFIDDPLSAEAVFKAPLLLNSSESYTKTLRVTDGNCWLNFDETTITVLTQPKKLPIDGSWSVCPFVEEVDYWIDEEEKYNLYWLVDGGEVVPGKAKDSIKINWWETNTNASVRVYGKNNFGCVSDTSIFAVRINVELITETPKGPDKLCMAEGKNVIYQIKNTNGSVYDWSVENGQILSGQGTNRISVEWKKDGLNNIVVKETSTTIDTICYGESEPLFVEVINDSLTIQLTNVSYLSGNEIELSFESEKLDFNKHRLRLEIENETGSLHDELPTLGRYHRMNREIYSEILRLKVINLCDEVFYSNPQQTIALKGNQLFSEDIIQLNWNRNQFWETNRLSHEIWHSEQENGSWQKVAQLDDRTDYDFMVQENSLLHLFRVKEINEDKNLESWSNTIKIEIDDNIEIPDVFTPNGDGFNDVWAIRNINYHTFKSVEIFNRFGEKVYECKNEFVPWDGKIKGKIYQGTYFYQITFDNDKRYGQITLLQ
ncbi:gliding motility-associated C-terminal domain-containing protein [Prolixibacteraceae bacterium Z1-6]|uniref:Gliding motility-associated C-terminal domain-containing protein n=1 Tax=Draconibacterium aestuarii TaxID=2998507 RepID=A0A9X3J980_9BACT|nr:gliding motility-associated C-terminal domain-containing protein [Prolixibacteraceae bacterium Z1-6]